MLSNDRWCRTWKGSEHGHIAQARLQHTQHACCIRLEQRAHTCPHSTDIQLYTSPWEPIHGYIHTVQAGTHTELHKTCEKGVHTLNCSAETDAEVDSYQHVHTVSEDTTTVDSQTLTYTHPLWRQTAQTKHPHKTVTYLHWVETARYLQSGTHYYYYFYFS